MTTRAAADDLVPGVPGPSETGPEPDAGRARPRSRPWWVALVALVVAGAVALPVLGDGGVNVRGSVHPVVLQSRTIPFDGRPITRGVHGPATLRVQFAKPTVAGTLLVATVIDGVVNNDMAQPHWQLARWRRGADTVGGQLGPTGNPQTGGLQSAIFYYPDNPGGLRSFDVGRVPTGTVTWVTVVLAEVSGVPAHLSVVARGHSTNGPTPADYTRSATVSTRSAPSRLPALVLASFTNGGLAPHGERFVFPGGWRVLGADPAPNGEDQPVLFDLRVWSRARAPTEWMRYLDGAAIDNCAVMVALA